MFPTPSLEARPLENRDPCLFCTFVLPKLLEQCLTQRMLNKYLLNKNIEPRLLLWFCSRSKDGLTIQCATRNLPASF